MTDTQLRILAVLAESVEEMSTYAVARAVGRTVTATTMAPLEQHGLIAGRKIRCGGIDGPCNRQRAREGLDPWLPTRTERRWTITDAGRVYA